MEKNKLSIKEKQYLIFNDAVRQNNKIMLAQSAVIMSAGHYFVADTDHLTDVLLQ
jgi:hypothetical protein